MDGQSVSNYKAIHRFIGQTDVKEALMWLYQKEADFVIGDPTEVRRYKACQSSRVLRQRSLSVRWAISTFNGIHMSRHCGASVGDFDFCLYLSHISPYVTTILRRLQLFYPKPPVRILAHPI
jgi:hypothetical protein